MNQSNGRPRGQVQPAPNTAPPNSAATWATHSSRRRLRPLVSLPSRLGRIHRLTQRCTERCSIAAREKVAGFEHHFPGIEVKDVSTGFNDDSLVVGKTNLEEKPRTDVLGRGTAPIEPDVELVAPLCLRQRLAVGG